jgi:hypothetical protein
MSGHSGGPGPQEERSPHGSRVAADAAAAAVLVGAGAVLALHRLRPDLAPASHRLSEYAVGSWGWLMTLSFAAMATGVWLLRRALPPDTRLRPVRALLAVTAAGLMLSALFRTDVTDPNAARETVHTLASGGALLSLVAAAVWTVTLGREAIGWRRARVPAAGATSLAVLGVVISPATHDGPWTGVVQRLSYVALVVWMLLVCRAVGAARTRVPTGDRVRPPR